MTLGVLLSHPVQYYSPLLRDLARRLDIHVFFAHNPSPSEQGAGFDTEFSWDVDLIGGFDSTFLENVSRHPGVNEFGGCDSPDVGARMAAHQIDSLLVLGWQVKTLVQATIAAKRLGWPVLVRGDSHLETPRGWAKRYAKAFIYPPLLRVFDAALYVGKLNREYYEHYRYPRDSLFFSPHCVDTAWFEERSTAANGLALRARLGISPDEWVVLFSGKLVEGKRPLDVLHAAAQVSRSGKEARVLVAGSGQMEQDIRDRAALLGVRVDMLGFQNQSEMPAVYAAANVLALPSSSETWGLVCNEALACGTPIIVSDACGCAPDLAVDGAGRIVPVGDQEALATALLSVLREPPAAAAIAAKSAQHSLGAAAGGIHRALDTVRQRKLGATGP